MKLIIGKLAVSSVAFKSVEEIESFYVETGIPIELGTNLNEQELSFFRQVKIKICSIHVPCPKNFVLPNFATLDESVLNISKNIFMKSCQTAIAFGSEIVVIHPGYRTNTLMPAESEERERSLQRMTGQAQVIVDRKYVSEEEYVLHFRMLEKNLRALSEEARKLNLKLACENLNPKYFYMVQTASEIERLASIDGVNICLDLGHLWIASLVHEFDFYSAVEEILETGKVIEIHASNNDSLEGRYHDSHDHLYRGSIDYRKVLRILKKYDHENSLFTIEVKDDPRTDLIFLRDINFFED